MTKSKLFNSLLISMMLLFAVSVNAQEKNSGKVKGKIFTNFNSSLSEGASAFELKRAYFGYEKGIGKNLTAFVQLDVGIQDLEDIGTIFQYTFFKNAGIKYKKGALETQIGLIGRNQFKVQEKFWGHRYVEKSFMDKYKWGASADLGIKVAYKFTDWISIDASITNGEGYKKVQADNNYKMGGGLIISPLKSLTLRLYSDVLTGDINQNTYAVFVGYKFGKLFSIAAEYNMMDNYKNNEANNTSGYSVYGSVNPLPKFELFARYDKLESTVIDGEASAWNIKKDGQYLLGGIQYKVNNYLKFAVNYQDWNPALDGSINEAFVFVNTEIKF